MGIVYLTRRSVRRKAKMIKRFDRLLDKMLSEFGKEETAEIVETGLNRKKITLPIVSKLELKIFLKDCDIDFYLFCLKNLTKKKSKQSEE